MIPELMTHNYDPDGVFLGNLCELPVAGAEKVLQGIRDAGRRPVKANYLPRRLATEAWLMAEKQRLLGPTQRERPIYFFLGNFADGTDPSRPCSIVMPLRALPRNVVTFTYPDSMASFAIATRDEHRPERRSYHGHVFTIDQIERVVEVSGMPGHHWKHDYSRRFDRFIEVQIWDERPLLEHFLSPSRLRSM
jgi:hypothetical protein